MQAHEQVLKDEYEVIQIIGPDCSDDGSADIEILDDGPAEMLAVPPPPPGPGMVFQDSAKLSKAWQAAEECVGEGCRVAAMPDLVDLLLAYRPTDAVWRQNITVNTGVYVGRNPDDEMVAVVGHGVGPLSRRDILLPGAAANRGWVPIMEEDFQALLNGSYGPVAVIPLKKCPPPRSDSVHEPLNQLQAIAHPLVREIFGPRTGELFDRLRLVAEEATKARDIFSHIEKRPGSRSPLIGLRDMMRTARFQVTDEGRPCGRLLTLSGLHQEAADRPLLEIGYHLDGQPVRLIAAQGAGRITRLHRGPQATQAEYRRRLPELLTPCPMLQNRPSVWAIMPIDRHLGIWATCQRRQPGEMADSLEPEFVCSQVSPRLATVSFRTSIKKREDELAFSQAVIAAVCRKHQANAYRVRAPIRIERHGLQAEHLVEVDLYRVAVKTSRRFPSWREIANDWLQLLKL